MEIDLNNKKVFLSWLAESISFPRREVYWILNYLLNHEAILTQMHIVENAEQTPRGILLFGQENTAEPLALYLQGHLFQDPAQIFHEIRFNWDQPLYFTCNFSDAWQNPIYLAALEDNPFYSWNKHLVADIEPRLEEYLQTEELQAKIRQLYRSADLALESMDEAALKQISQQLAALENQEEHFRQPFVEQ